MSKDLGPLSDLARQAIEAERNRPDVSVDGQERVLIRLATTAAVAATVGIAGVTTAATLAGTAGTSKVVAFKAAFWSMKGVALTAAAFVVGGAVGVAAHVAVQADVPTAAHTEGASSGVRALTLAATEPDSGAVAQTPDVGSAPSASLTEAGPPQAQSAGVARGADTSLAAERALIERARMALARGQSTEALDALNVHAKEHPGGRLGQEREALTIQALMAAGRSAEARARASRFRKAYPNSVFLGAVEGMVPASSASSE